MGGAVRRRMNRVAAAPATGGTCAFCRSAAQDETTVGRLYTLGDTTIHYYCVLVSCGLVQRGRDEEGLFGFLLDDVLAELNRGKKLKCSYCGCGGATLGCCRRACRKQFHLPCGRARGTVSLFYGNYQSFCVAHAPKQAVPDSIMAKARARMSRAKKAPAKSTVGSGGDPGAGGATTGECSEESCEAVCAVCYEEVDAWPSSDTFWPPCCARDRWLHTPCLQRMALSAGIHYLKCPLCNDKDAFQTAVAGHGVYIPDRDAAWELEEEAFAELYERPKSCSAEECQCYQGREYDADSGRWELKLCLTCGSAAAHAGCLAGSRYICALCSAVPPPHDLDALESLALAAPDAERGASPEYRPLMSHRMSLRRTKPRAATQRSAAGTRRDVFREERVVKLHRADNEAAEVDIFALDDPSSSKIVDTSPHSTVVPETQTSESPCVSVRKKSLRHHDTENTRTSRLSLGLKSPRLADRRAVEKYVAEVYGGDCNAAGRNLGASETESVTSGKNTTDINSTLRYAKGQNATLKNTVDENIGIKNMAGLNDTDENIALRNTAGQSATFENIADENIALRNAASQNATLANVVDENIAPRNTARQNATVENAADDNIALENTVDQNSIDRNAADNADSAKAKPLDKSSLVRCLEERILSPLKLIEEQIYCRLASGADSEFRARMDEDVRLVRRPGPMCVKKKMIGDILENILADCQRGSAGRAHPTVVELMAAERTRAFPFNANPTSNHTSATDLTKDVCTDLPAAPTKHSTPEKKFHWDQPTAFVDLSGAVDCVSPVEMSNNDVVLSVDESDSESLLKNDKSLAENIKNDVSLLKDHNISLVKDATSLIKNSGQDISRVEDCSNDISSHVKNDMLLVNNDNIVISLVENDNIYIPLVQNDNSVISLMENGNDAIPLVKNDSIISVVGDCKNEISLLKDKDTVNDSAYSETSFELSKELISEERLDSSLDSTKVDIKENSSLEIYDGQEKVNISYSVLEEPEKMDSYSEKTYVSDCVVLPDVKKIADIETFKSQYLSEVDRSSFQCAFNHKHETSGEVNKKARIKTAIDFAIDAAVMKRKAGKNKQPLSKNKVAKGRPTPQKSIMMSEKTTSTSENPINTSVPEKSILTRNVDLSLNQSKENIDYYGSSENVIVSPEVELTPEKSKIKIFSPEKTITVLSDTVLVPNETNVAVVETISELDMPNLQKLSPVTPNEPIKTPVIVYCKSPDVVDVSENRTNILNEMRNNFENSEIVSIVSYEEEKNLKINSRGKQKRGTLLKEMRKNFENSDNVTRELDIEALESVSHNLRKKEDAKKEKINHKKYQNKKDESNSRFNTTYSQLEQNIETMYEEMANEIDGLESYFKSCSSKSKKIYKKKISKHKRRTEIYIEKKMSNKSTVFEGKESDKGFTDKVNTKKHLKNKKKTETYFEHTSKEKTVKVMGKEKNNKNKIYKKKQKTELYYEKQSLNKTTGNEAGINEKNNKSNNKTDKKQMKDKIIAIDSELSENETEVGNERKNNHCKKRKLEQCSNDNEAQELKRKRQKINYSEETHSFMEELSAINDFYLKTDKKKKHKREDRNNIKSELKTNSTETKVLKQCVLNFSPETKKELAQESIRHKKTPKSKKLKTDIGSPDGLKQTSLKSFFTLHLTLN